MNIREHITKGFKEICTKKGNIINIKSSIPKLFKFITNPNEFAGPIVESWAHINFPTFFDKYEPAEAGKQTFHDAKVKLGKREILLNIKAKARGKETRSRINLSSFNRFQLHYKEKDCKPYYVIIFYYTWKVGLFNLIIHIEKLLYCFDLLDIPRENYKIEGAYEGSFRIFISPIPEVAKAEYSMEIKKNSPSDFVNYLNVLRDRYLSRKKKKNMKLTKWSS